MGPLIGVVVVALAALVALAVWRGRQVSVALAGAECPDCRVPLVPLRTEGAGPVLAGADTDPVTTWAVLACPRCERVVTTVGGLPSPIADCPSCRQRSLVVYAERADGAVVVDEWCDLCGRRHRATVSTRLAPASIRPRTEPTTATPESKGRVLPFRRQ
ncbi:MAG: hypothetical protein ABMB14_13835 [Myxococcota bacterium]